MLLSRSSQAPQSGLMLPVLTSESPSCLGSSVFHFCLSSCPRPHHHHFNHKPLAQIWKPFSFPYGSKPPFIKGLYSFCNKLPQGLWLKMAIIYFLTVLAVRSPKNRLPLRRPQSWGPQERTIPLLFCSNVCVSPKLLVEILASRVMALGGRALGGAMKSWQGSPPEGDQGPGAPEDSPALSAMWSMYKSTICLQKWALTGAWPRGTQSRTSSPRTGGNKSVFGVQPPVCVPLHSCLN